MFTFTAQEKVALGPLAFFIISLWIDDLQGQPTTIDTLAGMGGVSVHKAKEGLNKAAALGIAQLAGDRWQLSKLSSGGGMLSFFGQNLEPIIDTHAQPVDKTVDNSDETVDNFPENGETEEKKIFFPY